MDITAIVFLSLLIVYTIVCIVRDSFKRRWYRSGYIDAAIKYDESEYRTKTYSQEADSRFEKQFGVEYD